MDPDATRPSQIPLTANAEAEIVVLDGPAAGQRATLRRQLTIGRSSRCDLTLPGQLVSRNHAEIVRGGGGFVVRDLGSVNGTYVNGRMVTQSSLHHGDELSFGDTTARVLLGVVDSAERTTGSNVVLYTAPQEDTGRIRLRGEPTALSLSLASADAARAERAQLRLEALVTITENLTRLRELDVLYPLVVDEIQRVLPAERMALLLPTGNGGLEPRIARNLKRPGERVAISRTIVDEVVTERQCVLSADAMFDDNIDVSESILIQQIRSVLCVPIEYEDDLLGVLYLDSPGRDNLFTEEDLHFVSGIAGAAAVAITNARSLEQVRLTAQQLNRTYLSMLAVLANAIEARDHYTIGHTWRVARFAQAIARRLGWDEDRVGQIEVGGMLHDIGKIGVPDSILTKPGRLDREELELMELHPQIGARMLRDVPSLHHVLPYVLHHHERWDGKGYPDRLVGDAIPIEARLLAVADTLDAMTSNRPYRPGLDPRVVIEELRQEAGRQFDPAVVEALASAWEAGELTPYLQAGLDEAGDFVCPHCSTFCTPEEAAVERGEMACPICARQLRLYIEDGLLHADLA
jgi:response regulator RpfG family c-di-GMP phosphodiesterase/pSer/pThr/pTyr-binding forkhead associated (FHA) protein